MVNNGEAGDFDAIEPIMTSLYWSVGCIVACGVYGGIDSATKLAIKIKMNNFINHNDITAFAKWIIFEITSYHTGILHVNATYNKLIYWGGNAIFEL